MIPMFYRRAARWIVVALAGALAFSGQPRISNGAEEASGREAARGESPCVLLRNGNVLFGRCREQGEWVTVTSGDDSRIRLPRRDIVSWAPSLRQLYQQRLQRQRPDDIKLQLENVRWCLRYDLFDLAAAELRKIYRHDPEHAGAKRLEQRLRRQAARPNPASPSESGAVGGADQADAESEAAPDSDSRTSEPASASEPGFDLNTLQAFAHQVQPMLINRCGQCHSHMSDRHWRLIVPAGRTRASARMTRENLASLSAYLDRDAALESELLERAVSAHGGTEGPPLGPSDSAAIARLKSWLQQARSASAPADGPSETPPATPAAAAMPDDIVHPVRPEWPLARHGAATPAAGELAGEIPAAASGGADAAAGTEQSSRSPAERPLKRPARLPPVDNPFDPSLFNRQYRAK